MKAVRKNILLDNAFGREWSRELSQEFGKEISCRSLCIEIAYQEEIVYRIHIGEEKEDSASLDDFAQKVFQELAEYFAGQRKVFTFAHAFAGGTEFQNRVWQEIAKIPFGETISYSELAKLAGNEKAYRAAAGACHDNPIPFCVPCHRVIAKSGAMQGYGYGLAMKRALLNLEKTMRNGHDNR